MISSPVTVIVVQDLYRVSAAQPPPFLCYRCRNGELNHVAGWEYP